MGCINLIRAIFVRLIFSCHGLIAIWRLVIVSKDDRYWYLTAALGGLFLESLFTICKKKGREWKWFCPSVLFYLLSVVPAIWFLELDELRKRIQLNDQFNSTSERAFNESSEDLHATLGSFGLEFEIRIPLVLSSDQWIKTIEQVLLLCLIIGRWILPKGKLTHDQLSQLLLVYIGTAADIVEFFDAFKEDQVKTNEMLCVIILSIWSWSLLQFTMVLTATRARKDQSGLVSKVPVDPNQSCCTPDVYGIIISIFMQDAPFLVLRLLLIFRYDVVSYTNMFFTSKNTLVILLLMYRLIVVQCTLRKEVQKSKKESQRVHESNSRQGLLHSYSDGNACGGRSPNGYKYYAPSNLATSYTYDELQVLAKKNKHSRDKSRPNSSLNSPVLRSPRPEFRPCLDLPNNVHVRSDDSGGTTPFSTPMLMRHEEFTTPASTPVSPRGHKMWDPQVERCPKSLLIRQGAQTLGPSRPNSLDTHMNSHENATVHKPIRASKSCEALSSGKVKVQKGKSCEALSSGKVKVQKGKSCEALSSGKVKVQKGKSCEALSSGKVKVQKGKKVKKKKK